MIFAAVYKFHVYFYLLEIFYFPSRRAREGRFLMLAAFQRRYLCVSGQSGDTLVMGDTVIQGDTIQGDT